MRIDSGWVYLLVVTCSCINRPDIGLKTVRDVSLEGSDSVDEDDVLEGLAHHPIRGYFIREPALYRRAVLEDDMRRIRIFYHRRGYFGAELEEPKVTIEGNEAFIVYRVREGPPFRVNTIELKGANALPGHLQDELRCVLLIRTGERFDYEDFEKDLGALRQRLLSKSYYDAKITGRVSVNTETQRVDVRYRVKPGKAKTIAHVTTIDSDFLPQDSIDARLKPLEGQAYSPEVIRTAEGRLYALDLVSATSFDVDSDPETTDIDMEVRLGQALKNELRFGGGFLSDSDNTIVRAQANYLRRRFFHPLRRLRIDLRSEYFIEAARPGFSGVIDILRHDPLGILRSQLTYGIAYGLNQYSGFQSLSIALRGFFDQPLIDDRLNLRISPGITSYTVNIGSDLLRQSQLVEAAGLTGALFTRLRGELSFDGRNNPIDPSSGWFSALAVEIGKVLDNEKPGYMLLSPRLNGYLPLGTRRVIGALRLSGTANLGQSPLPLPARVFGGGSGKHRGFARRTLSPGVVDDGNYLTVGGEFSVLATIEMRVDVIKIFKRWAGIVVFGDAGDVALRNQELLLSPPHIGAGAGLRYATPVGPLRLDFGFRLNRDGPQEPAPGQSWAFHLAIGEAF